MIVVRGDRVAVRPHPLRLEGCQESPLLVRQCRYRLVDVEQRGHLSLGNRLIT